MGRGQVILDNSNAPFPRAWLGELAELDARWQGGDRADPIKAAQALERWRRRLGRSPSPEEEWLDVVNASGEPLGWAAPRWFCHLTGLRHRVIHVFLFSPQGFLLLQMRAHNKAEWPSRFDTSVGGHIKAGQSWLQGALAEIEEELGLPAAQANRWLVEAALVEVGEPYERYDIDETAPPIRNRQINRTYTGRLTEWGLAHLRFADREVAGVFLCALDEARRMVEEDFLIAPGLKHALPIIDSPFSSTS